MGKKKDKKKDKKDKKDKKGKKDKKKKKDRKASTDAASESEGAGTTDAEGGDGEKSEDDKSEKTSVQEDGGGGEGEDAERKEDGATALPAAGEGSQSKLRTTSGADLSNKNAKIPPQQNYTLDLTCLTFAEEKALRAVLDRDEVEQKAITDMVRVLKREQDTIRYKGFRKQGDPIPKCMRGRRRYLRWRKWLPFFDQGGRCIKCQWQTCKEARHYQANGKYMCGLCVRQREIKWLTGEWLGTQATRLHSSELIKVSLKDKEKFQQMHATREKRKNDLLNKLNALHSKRKGNDSVLNSFSLWTAKADGDKKEKKKKKKKDKEKKDKGGKEGKDKSGKKDKKKKDKKDKKKKKKDKGNNAIPGPSRDVNNAYLDSERDYFLSTQEEDSSGTSDSSDDSDDEDVDTSFSEFEHEDCGRALVARSEGRNPRPNDPHKLMRRKGLGGDSGRVAGARGEIEKKYESSSTSDDDGESDTEDEDSSSSDDKDEESGEDEEEEEWEDYEEWYDYEEGDWEDQFGWQDEEYMIQFDGEDGEKIPYVNEIEQNMKEQFSNAERKNEHLHTKSCIKYQPFCSDSLEKSSVNTFKKKSVVRFDNDPIITHNSGMLEPPETKPMKTKHDLNKPLCMKDISADISHNYKTKQQTHTTPLVSTEENVKTCWGYKNNDMENNRQHQKNHKDDISLNAANNINRENKISSRSGKSVSNSIHVTNEVGNKPPDIPNLQFPGTANKTQRSNATHRTERSSSSTNRIQRRDLQGDTILQGCRIVSRRTASASGLRLNNEHLHDTPRNTGQQQSGSTKPVTTGKTISHIKQQDDSSHSRQQNVKSTNAVQNNYRESGIIRTSVCNKDNNFTPKTQFQVSTYAEFSGLREIDDTQGRYSRSRAATRAESSAVTNTMATSAGVTSTRPNTFCLSPAGGAWLNNNTRKGRREVRSESRPRSGRTCNVTTAQNEGESLRSRDPVYKSRNAPTSPNIAVPGMKQFKRALQGVMKNVGLKSKSQDITIDELHTEYG